MTMKRPPTPVAWASRPALFAALIRRYGGLRSAGTAKPGWIVAPLLLALVSAAPIGNPPSTAPAQRVALPPFDPLGLVNQLASARDQDPIGYLVTDADELTALLARFNTRRPVQPRQEQFVAHLDKLIAMLEKQCSGSGGASPNPTRPMADSKITQGPGGAGPLHDPQQGTKTWGQLTPKQREQILQSQTEGFPQGFESILSSYYKRLAQENVGENAPDAAAAAPTTQPR